MEKDLVLKLGEIEEYSTKNKLITDKNYIKCFTCPANFLYEATNENIVSTLCPCRKGAKFEE